MRSIRFVFFITVWGWWVPENLLFADDEQKKRTPGTQSQGKISDKKTAKQRPSSQRKKPPVDTTTVIESDVVESKVGEPSSAAPVERIFKNPVLMSGFNSGADAINRSINSLMESLFYNLMDNDIKHDLTGNASVGFGLKRDVLQSENGTWVIIDRMGMGPSFGKELYRFNDIPVNLGASQSNEVFDIYLRSDPMRISEPKRLPFWRVAVNNWFGILPVLEAVLPPSFNANEMYDPLRRIEAPFTFPLSVESFEGMETGSIKSYSISGGITLGIELSEGIHGYKDMITQGSSALDVKLPYSVFRTGEYRVNVLRRDLNTAWVGITDTTRTGHRFETKIGKTYYLLSKTIPYWKGLAAPFFPLEFGFEESIADLFGKVYSFDMRFQEARAAYLEAVHGNLAPAELSWFRSREDKIETGVSFFFTKKEQRQDTSKSSGQSMFAINKNTKTRTSDAEIEITDKDGKFYILEAKQSVDKGTWDILTGPSNSDYTGVSDLKVERVYDARRPGPKNYTYQLVAESNPIDTVLTLQIKDKFVETEDFKSNLDSIGRFTSIDLEDELPDIPLRDSDDLSLKRKKRYFDTDISGAAALHVTPTFLGSFEGYASVHILTKDLNRIATLPREAHWQAFCSSFGISKRRCAAWQESAIVRHLDRVVGWTARPFQLLDIRSRRLDAVDEIEDAMQALRAFAKAEEPESKQLQLRRLLATAYPLELSQTLTALVGEDSVTRRIQFTTNPKGNGAETSKAMFKMLDGKRIVRGPKTPPPARYDTTQDTEAKFNPANISFAGIKPVVRKLALFRSEDMDSTDGRTELAVRLYATRLDEAEDLNIYVRVEQVGKVQLAKLKLAEDVISVPIADAAFDFEAGTSNYLVRLTGPNAAIQSLLLSQAVELGGSFRATFGVSTNGVLWSDENHVEFRMENGKLLPLQ